MTGAKEKCNFPLIYLAKLLWYDESFSGTNHIIHFRKTDYNSQRVVC